MIYTVAAILTNIKTCMMGSHYFDQHGNAIANKFGLSPPSVREYLYGSV